MSETEWVFVAIGVGAIVCLAVFGLLAWRGYKRYEKMEALWQALNEDE